MTRKVLGCVLLLVGLAVEASAIQAVAEIREESFYTQRKASLYPGASLKRFYAPFPVFLEGWKSAPRTDIVLYAWNFGDGSPMYYGFNAAHVYENPGTYYARLTVKDKYGNQSTSPYIRIDVLAPNGRTFYVDSEIGNDSNTGLSPATPWKTATMAFTGINWKRYKPGDRILFKRGQIFEAECGKVLPGMYSTGFGYTFGAYGEGPKPIIQKVGSSTLPMIKISALGFGHVCFQDLEFRMTSPDGIQGGEMFAVQMEAHSILFLRVDIKDMNRGIGINGGYSSYRISNVYVIDCTMQNSANVQMFARCARLALLDNNFDLSSNHINYMTYVDKGVIARNVFTRPPFGRTALRMSAATSTAYPTNNVCITDNWIEGWMDPRKDGGTHTGGGTRYTWQLVDIGPNKEGMQYIEHVTFTRNTVLNGETLLILGDATDVEVSHNTFYTEDPYNAANRIELGSRFEARPLKDIRIFENTISSNEARWYYAAIVAILPYKDPAWGTLTAHTGIQIHDNEFDLRNSNGAAVIYVGSDTSAQLCQVKSDRNAIYSPCLTPGNSNLFMIGGGFATGKLIGLPEWRSRTGNDMNSGIAGTSMNYVLAR